MSPHSESRRCESDSAWPGFRMPLHVDPNSSHGLRRPMPTSASLWPRYWPMLSRSVGVGAGACHRASRPRLILVSPKETDPVTTLSFRIGGPWPCCPGRATGGRLLGVEGKAGRGASISGGGRVGNRPVPHAQKKSPMTKSIKSRNGWGGRRKGAGRPAGSRNKPRLIEGLPSTQDPVQWLLALMNHTGAPIRLRVACAVALLPYFHTRKG